VTPDQVERNRAQQAELYGEPLGELLRRIAGTLGLTQARMAETVGLSAPMLSQLISAQRVKIGNPAVVQRIQALDQLAADVTDERVDPAALAQRLDAVRGATAPISRTTHTGSPRPSPAGTHAVVRGIQDVLRTAASAEELLAAAGRLEPDHPRLAELLRVYGTGRTDDAVALYERTITS
jgi:transcriptional regulator with XRE-family HTH domain